METKEKLRVLVEERRILAIKNQIAPKMISIAKNLGQKIVGTTIFDNRLSDAWRADDNGFFYDNSAEIHTVEEDDGENWTEYDVGFAFDGLKCGINLCITCMAFDNKVVEIKATYNGYLVFAEIEGVVKAYAPFPAWEDALNMFYEGAIIREKHNHDKERKEKEKERRKRFAKFWEAFKNLWNYQKD